MRRCICKTSVLLILIAVFSFKVSAGENTEGNKKSGIRSIIYGIASFYHASLNGYRTYNGERYLNSKLTAAHKTLPMGTMVRVTDLRNHKSVIVRINDRLPQNSKRMIDLSQSAATKLHLMSRGLSKVKLEVVPKNSPLLAKL